MNVASVALRLIDEEEIRSCVKRPEALRIIAREAGLAPGSLENLARGRLKHVGRIAGNIYALYVKKLELQISECQTLLAVARAGALASPEIDIPGAEAALEAARRCLGKA